MSSESKNHSLLDDPPSEVDFSGGVRGRHAARARGPHTVTINRRDGSQLVQHFVLEEGSVQLDPDVQKHFPDSDSVNQALRRLIAASAS